MTKQLLVASLIKQLNKKLREPWSETDLLRGKQISVLWEDMEIGREVVPMFIDKGWVIKKKEALIEASGRKILLFITKPPFEDNMQ